MNRIAMTALMMMLLAQPSQAADISGEVRGGADEADTSDGGFLEVGFRASLWTNPWIGDGNLGEYGYTLAGEYRYKGLFVEAIDDAADGINLGYQLWNNEQWTVDFIGFNASPFPERHPDPYDASAPCCRLRVQGSDGLRGAGFRVTRYFDEYIFQFRVLDDVYRNRGFYSSARVGRSWQYRNWNFHALAGLEYVGSENSQRAYGITAIEAARSRFPQFSTGSLLQTEVEVGVTYPVTEHVVFRSIVRQLLLGDAADSPLLEEDNRTLFLISLSYVF